MSRLWKYAAEPLWTVRPATLHECRGNAGHSSMLVSAYDDREARPGGTSVIAARFFRVQVIRSLANSLLTIASALVATAVACNEPSREKPANVEVPAALIVVERLDEEGGIIGRTFVPDSTRAAYFRSDTLFADAAIVANYLVPRSRVDVLSGKLSLDGKDTGIPVEIRDSVAFVALLGLADRFGAFVRTEKTPGRMATLWRNDVLCRYAHGADRRAPVFLEAAERGLLRRCRPAIEVEVRRWANATPKERWAASLVLRRPLDSAKAAELLGRYDAAPYAAYGSVAGHQLIARSHPDSASTHLFGQLRAKGIAALESALCGLPAALARRSQGTVLRTQGRDSDAFHAERYMLASAAAARRELPRLRAGAAMIYGMDVIATAEQLRRLADDGRTKRFEPATKLDTTWVTAGVDSDATSGVPIPTDIAALDSAKLFTELQAEATRAAAGCKTD